jgi:hypothetical protein
LNKIIIILGFSKKQENFQRNFEIIFASAPYYKNLDEKTLASADYFTKGNNFITLKVNSGLVDIWFAGVFPLMYKPWQDSFYKDADALIAFGYPKNNVVKYVQQMKRVYCPNAIGLFPDKLTMPIWNNLTKNYSDDEFKEMNLFILRKQFADFFGYLLRATQDHKYFSYILKSEQEISKVEEVASKVTKASAKAASTAASMALSGLTKLGKKIGNAASNKVLKKDVFDMQTRVAGEHPAKYDTKTKLKMSFLEYNKMCEKRNAYRKAMGTKVFDPGLENAWLNDL